ncbi:MAG: cobalamin B12-binding domain-containing protein [Candidatus Aminicenantes bacterium]|nr:cobalamin B12-binding domain-containing protein [Candidatus Aminicenantes bacterium]
MKKKILGAALGSCVHVGGLHHFLELAKAEGYETESLGPAVPVERLLDRVEIEKPGLVAVSYRLTPETATSLFEDMKKGIAQRGIQGVRFIFGGTPPAAETARKAGLFERIFGDRDPLPEIIAYLRGEKEAEGESRYAPDLLGRIRQSYPYPLLRHHFGRPTLKETVSGAKAIAESRVMDVISIGPDQNAQEHFFHPEKMDHGQDGAGGVPIRKPEDLAAIYESSRCGNYPLVRCYSGTRDLLLWAEMSVRTIHNAWAAIPLCWYNVMDGRSGVPLKESILEKQEAMRWYAGRGIPVEVNEAHQWSLREAHDSLAVAMAFLAAYNAKKMGVKHYVAQYMFNTPPGTSPRMDLGKMLAKKELIASLHDEQFTSFTEVRAGIAHFSSVPEVAQGQLAASGVVSLALNPHILHVVGYSEGDHAAYPDEVVHSCHIVHGTLKNCLEGMPDMKSDPEVQKRKQELIGEAQVLLGAISELGKRESEDSWTDAAVLARAIKEGLLDTPHFKGNPHLCGKISTRLIDGAWHAVDGAGKILREAERTRAILDRISGKS